MKTEGSEKELIPLDAQVITQGTEESIPLQTKTHTVGEVERPYTILVINKEKNLASFHLL